ncbi:MAG: DUF1178 family protein [Thermodesulfobacteriota bacterium]|nr:DUF1178 family protein [Thermodesulfobacteriota bacterium]
MIVFDLECVNDHTFEGWFEDSKSYEKQQEQGLITCPVCGTASVTQKLSPIAVKTSSMSTPELRARASHDAMIELGAKISDFVEKNFEDVGSNFTKEALKMHYGASESKNIRGTTTKEDDKVLDKEGIAVLKFPLPPKSGNDDLN